MCLNHEKKWRSKIWWHTPVKKIVLFKTNYFLWKNKVLRINFPLHEVFLDIHYTIYDNIQPESKYLQFIILYTCVCLRCRTRIQAKYCQNEKVHFNKSYMYITQLRKNAIDKENGERQLCCTQNILLFCKNTFFFIIFLLTFFKNFTSTYMDSNYRALNTCGSRLINIQIGTKQ